MTTFLTSFGSLLVVRSNPKGILFASDGAIVGEVRCEGKGREVRYNRKGFVKSSPNFFGKRDCCIKQGGDGRRVYSKNRTI